MIRLTLGFKLNYYELIESLREESVEEEGDLSMEIKAAKGPSAG